MEGRGKGGRKGEVEKGGIEIKERWRREEAEGARRGERKGETKQKGRKRRDGEGRQREKTGEIEKGEKERRDGEGRKGKE